MPSFDLNDFKVEPITCSGADKGWNMTLPEVSNPANLGYSISRADKSTEFVLSEDSLTVILNESYEKFLTRGQKCPNSKLIPLTFKLNVPELSRSTS